MAEDDKKDESKDGIVIRAPFGIEFRIDRKTLSSEIVVRYVVAPIAILLGLTCTLWGIAQIVSAWKGATP